MLKRKILVSLVAAATLAVGTPSFAHGGDGHGYRDHPHQRDDARHGGRHHHHHHHQGWARGRGHDTAHVHVVRQAPRWHRGDRLPSAYRHQRYIVRDWHAHRLSAPPRGQQWVHVDAGYVLVAAATGIITHLILNQ